MNKVLLSALSGAMIGAAFSLPSLSFFVWFSLAPFIYVLYKSTFRKGLICSLIFSFFYYGCTMFWISHATTLGFLLLMGYLSLYPLLYFLMSRYLRSRKLRLITFSCAWVLIELLKEIIWPYCGWAQLGYSQFNNIYFIQIADIGGAKIISWIVVMVNVLIVESIISIQKKESLFNKAMLRKYYFSLGVVILCFGYGIFRVNTIYLSGSHKVAIVQPNTPEVFRYNDATEGIVKKNLISLGKAAEDDALVVYPEATWPMIVDELSLTQVKDVVKAIDRDMVMGAVRRDSGNYFNSALFFKKDGELVDFYYKTELVPYGEYIPLRKYLSFISVINQIGDMNAGTEKAIFSHKGKKFSTLICFEDSFPMLVREFAKGNDFLINITNDGWFHGEPEATQHLGIMIIRAIENRIPIVRSANTGVSGWVSPTGEFNFAKNAPKKNFVSLQKTFEINLTSADSIYSRCGESFSLACVGFLFIFAFRTRKINH
jgi:apolipoprotein N-acyltransferase